MSYNPQAACDGVLYNLKYRDHTRVRRDAMELVGSYPSLLPSASPMPSGGAPLLTLAGTVPILFQGARYNIPVRLWVPDAYPYRPPTVYVTPTPDMAIVRGHKHVDPAGMVYLPYLNTWNPASHSLLGLAQALCQVFGMQPPLYSSRGAAPQQQQQQSQSQSQSPPMQQRSPYQQQYPPAPYGGAPQQQQPTQMYSSYMSPSVSPPYGGNPYGGQPPQGQPSPYQQMQTQMQSAPLPQRQQSMSMPPQPPPEDAETALKRKKREEIERKMRARLSEFLRYDEDDRQEREFVSLATKSQADAQRIAALEQQRAALDVEIAQAEKKLAEVAKWVDDQEQRASQGTAAGIDETSDPVDVHRKQLIKSVAVDHMLEDVLYSLDQALKSHAIQLDEYLKLFRQFSEEQFTVRALVFKIKDVISGKIPNR